MTADIIYVDKNDNEIGHGQIQNAVEKGIVRRISRVIVTNSRRKILLQKRGNVVMYPFRWNDSVSGHVDVGETYREAALREMKEEMGITGIELFEIGKFYGAEASGEREPKAFNMLFTGTYDADPVIDSEEVSDFKWVREKDLKEWLEEKPDDFTPGTLTSFELFFNKRD